MSDLDLSARRANISSLRAKATTDDERWICDEFVRLFDEIERLRNILKRIGAESDCGCWPCTGQCRSEGALLIEVEEMKSAANEALK